MKSFFVVGGLLLLLLAGWGYLRHRAPAQPWGPSSHGMALSLQLPKATYTVGEPIEATLTIKNTGKKEMHFCLANLFEESHVVLLDQHGGTPPMTEAYRDALNRPHDGTYNLLMRVTMTVPSQQTTDISVSITDRYTITQPGAYQLCVLRPTPKETSITDLFSWQDGCAVSNVVSLTVVKK